MRLRCRKSSGDTKEFRGKSSGDTESSGDTTESSGDTILNSMRLLKAAYQVRANLPSEILTPRRKGAKEGKGKGAIVRLTFRPRLTLSPSLSIAVSSWNYRSRRNNSPASWRLCALA